MAGVRSRADAGDYAGRVNAAADLLASGVAVAEAAHIVAERFGISVRQARRYVERAATSGLPAALVARVRERARESGSTLSALVAQALTEFLARGHRKRPRR